MAASTLSEPEVLAFTKRRIFSDTSAAEGFAVTDTQFSTDEWLDGEAIPSEVTDELSPYNRVKVGTGYPDLVGAGKIPSDLYRGSRHDVQSSPLVVLEAKGHSADESVDPEEGVVQAHNRLAEANVAFVTAPSNAITEDTLSLGRELNVGIIGVSSENKVEILERPRIVGSQIGKDAAAIRLQAGPHSVAKQSFYLNRPKNYLGYPFAVYHSDPTDEVMRRYVVGDVRGARNGAAFLGLVEKRGDGGDVLTPLGEEVLRFGFRKYDRSLTSILEQFESWKGRRKRFTELAPDWSSLGRWVVFSYPITQSLIEHIQAIQNRGDDPILPAVVSELFETSPTLAIEFFIRDIDDARSSVLTKDGELVPSELYDPSVYRSVTVYQYKQMLYHTGIVAETGADTNQLIPEESNWQLEHPV
ncbi:hypothetical protein JCM17823_05140 [Halorubrum gandharaense]